MKLLKSPWFYTAIVAFILWFSPVGSKIGYYTDGFTQYIGGTNGKQLAFVLFLALVLPVILTYYLAKYALRNVRK